MRRGKMNAVQPNHRRRRLHQLSSRIKAIGRMLAQLRSWSWNMIKFVGRAVRRLRPMVPAVIVAVLAGATVVTVVWLHSAARTSPDAWPSSVAAGTTATLALITLWYAYLTHRLLEAQRSAARTAGWETALRDLSLNPPAGFGWRLGGSAHVAEQGWDELSTAIDNHLVN
jgi:hypothetical protein